MGKKTTRNEFTELKPMDSQIPPEWASKFEVQDGSMIPVLDISSDQLQLPKLLQTPAAGSSATLGIPEAAAPVSEGKTKKGKGKPVKEVPVPPKATASKPKKVVVDGLEIPNRRPEVDPIWVGEKVHMDVTWLAAQAGDFILEVKPHRLIKTRKVYNFRGTAKTSKLFSIIYKAEDWVETFVDYEGWFPYRFILHGDESKHIRDTVELFDHAARKQYVHMRDNRRENGMHEEKNVKDLVRYSQDSLSAIYYLRTLKFDVGTTVRFPMTTNGDQWEMDIKVLGREPVSTEMGDIPCLKLQVQTRFNGGLRQQGDSFLWLSDNEKRYPIKFEAKVKIGWVSGVAKKIEAGSPN